MEVGEEGCLEGVVCWVQVVWSVVVKCGGRVYGVGNVYRRYDFSKCDVGIYVLVVEVYNATMD